MWGDQVKEVYMPEGWDKMNWSERVEAFLASEDTAKRFTWPFPMAVFGTLRKAQGNNGLMHRARVEDHRCAFLPHFLAHGLSVSCLEDSSAPFEVFYYKPEEWAKMLYSVDRLEGFSPEHAHGRTNGGYYYRTLAWLRLLPEAHECGWFPAAERVNLWGERNMQIAPEKWAEYERVPCWIYSNMNSNNNASKLKNSPVIWPTGNKGN